MSFGETLQLSSKYKAQYGLDEAGVGSWLRVPLSGTPISNEARPKPAVSAPWFGSRCVQSG